MKKENATQLKRRWFPLWKLDGYIMREFLIKYTILLLLFIILFVLNDIYRDIADFFDAQADWREIAAYLICKIPGNIRFILPISMLLGCMWTMATFGKYLEVTAMRASGVSLFRCGGAILFAGLIVSIVNIYFNEKLVPQTSVIAEKIYDQSSDSRRYVHSLLTYRSDDGKRRWLFQEFTSGKSFNSVTLKTFWNDSTARCIAGISGTPQYATMMKKILGEKRWQQLNALPPELRRERMAKLMNNRKIDFNIKNAEYDTGQKCWIFRSGTFICYDNNDETMFKASSGTTAMHDEIEFTDLVFDEAAIPESPEDIANSIKEKDELSTVVIWQILRRNPNMPERARAIYQTVFFYRLAFPWASFLAVFLGIPLAAKNERTGSMLAIISAIIMIVIYIITAQLFLMLGKSGAVPPVVAGLAPTISFIVIGVWRLLFGKN